VRRHITALAIAVLAAGAVHLGGERASAQPAAGPRLDLSAVDLSGAPYDTRSLAGEPVLVDFWAVWCAPCIASFPLLNELHEARASDGVRVVGVAVHSGGPDAVAAFLQDHSPAYEMVVGDEELAERYGIVGFPTYLLCGPDGALVETYVGKLESFVEDLRSRVALLKEPSGRAAGGGR